MTLPSMLRDKRVIVAAVLVMLVFWMLSRGGRDMTDSGAHDFQVLEKLQAVKLLKAKVKLAKAAAKYIASLDAYHANIDSRGKELVAFYTSPALHIALNLKEPAHPKITEGLFDIARATEDFCVAEEAYNLEIETIRFHYCKQFGMLSEDAFTKALEQKTDLDEAIAFAREWVPQTTVLTDALLDIYMTARVTKDDSVLGYPLCVACRLAHDFQEKAGQQ